MEARIVSSGSAVGVQKVNDEFTATVDAQSADEMPWVTMRVANQLRVTRLCRERQSRHV